VRERLNSVLERAGTLVLSENGGKTIGPGGDIERHPRFRVFATMNPVEMGAREKMSAAEKDRWTSYRFVTRPSEEEFKAMMRCIIYGEQPSIKVDGENYGGTKEAPKYPELAEIKDIDSFITFFSSFFHTLEEKARDGDIGKNQLEKYSISRRKLIEFFEFIATKRFVTSRRPRRTIGMVDDPKRVVLFAIKHFFLDILRTDDDRTKVKTLLKTYKLTEETWNHMM
jgi:hypothetical protein